jgi:hypothetical protein
MVTAFPKIFAIGQDYISKLFDGPVEITEKVDGSQFIFGKLNGELMMRSKGCVIHDYRDRKESDLFYPAIQHVMSIEHLLTEGCVYYSETLCRPKHNTLKYERTPKNNIALFGISVIGRQSFCDSHDELSKAAQGLDIDVVPLIHRGVIRHADELRAFMDKPSYLGGTNAEGIVVKNYAQPFLLGGQPIPVMAGKYVSEAFKEVHRKNWTKENTGAGKWQLFKESYRTEARWHKAVQHLNEAGEIEFSPKDIGKLITEIKRDITEEEKETIKEFLWREFGSEVLRVAVGGFPEWYKQQLLDLAFTDKEDDDA